MANLFLQKTNTLQRTDAQLLDRLNSLVTKNEARTNSENSTVDYRKTRRDYIKWLNVEKSNLSENRLQTAIKVELELATTKTFG